MGIIPGGRNTIDFSDHTRFLAHELYDGPDQPKDLALDYTASGTHRLASYADYYAAYTSAKHLYAYDHLLFSGHLMSVANTRRLTTSRGITAPPDQGIDDPQWADGWKVGKLFGQSVVYTAGNLNDYQTANLWFPRLNTSVVVMANTASTDALNIAEHAAAFVLPGHEAQSAAVGAPSTRDLVGVYIRRWTSADRPFMTAQGGTHDAAALRAPIFCLRSGWCVWRTHGARDRNVRQAQPRASR